MSARTERPRTLLAGVLIAGVALLAGVGCGDSSTTAKSIKIDRASTGSSWPFTVERGTLTCGSSGWVTFDANGTRYAVNSPALDHAKANGLDWPDSQEIWSHSPTAEITPIINRGLKLCGLSGY